jgi:hypothetical protein
MRDGFGKSIPRTAQGTQVRGARNEANERETRKAPN